MPTSVQPSFKAKTPINQALARRLCRLASPGKQYHPRAPRFALDERDFFSPVIEIQVNGSHKVTFLNDRYFEKKYLKKGNEPKSSAMVVCKVPDPELSAGMESVRGIIIRTDIPYGHTLLIDQITKGAAPAILDQTHLTFDVTCSIQTALELGAAVWKWPDLYTLSMSNMVQDPMIAQLADGLGALGFVGPNCKPDDAELMHAAMQEIEDLVKKVYAKVRDTDVVKMLLPISTVVTGTVTKSILGWRSCFQTKSDCAETAWLKSTLYKYLRDAAPPLFIGCDAAAVALNVWKDRYV